MDPCGLCEQSTLINDGGLAAINLLRLFAEPTPADYYDFVRATIIRGG
jgi:hypothetical protein